MRYLSSPDFFVISTSLAEYNDLENIFQEIIKKCLTNLLRRGIIYKSSGDNDMCGGLAQLGEHLPYKQRVTGSSPVVPTIGPVVQLVRTLACHARGREFEPHPGRHCGFSSSGRAPPCQGGGSEFEPRNPLQNGAIAKW